MLIKIWEIFTSTLGLVPYYYNKITGKSTLKKPDNLNKTIDIALPPDWIEVKEEKPYYFWNTKTAETTYHAHMIYTSNIGINDNMQPIYDEIPVSFNDITRENSNLKRVFGKDYKYKPLVITGCKSPITINGYLRQINYPIKSLDIEGCSHNQETIQLICQLRTLTTLSLNGIQLIPQNILTITQGLPRLTNLSVSACGLGPEGAQAIAENMPNLTYIDISQNRLGNEGAIFIMTGGLHRLIFINISANDIEFQDREGVDFSLPLLTSLDISRNIIREVSLRAITENLPHLTQLNLSRTRLDANGCIYIAENLKLLTTLDITGNYIGEYGITTLRNGLPLLTDLQY